MEAMSVCCEAKVGRRIHGGILLAALLSFCIAAVAALPPIAQAARVHQLELSETLPEGRIPFVVAINQATQHIYVVAGGSGRQRRVYNFEPNGEVDAADPELTSAPGFEAVGLAVDNSGGTHGGFIYASNGVQIVQFEPSGGATAVSIDESALPSNGTAQGGGLPPVVNPGTFQPRALAVGESGDVFASDSATQGIDVFTPDGEFVKQLAAGTIGAFPTGIALDPAGGIFVSRNEPDGPGPGLFELEANGECATVGCTPIDGEPVDGGVTVDDADGKLFTSTRETNAEGKFSEYELTTGTLIGTTRQVALHQPYGIAVEETTGEVVVVDGKPEAEATIQIYGPSETVPTPVTGAAESITDHSAVLRGTLKPEEAPESTCAFQFVAQSGFEAEGFEDASEAPCEPSGPFTGSGTEPVEASVTGLRGGTTYHVRLVARLVGETKITPNPGDGMTFQTVGPTVSASGVSEVGIGAATLVGLIDPNGVATTYRFEFLTQGAYEANPSSERWAGATQVPAGGESIGSGTTAVAVAQRVEGLISGVAYRMRIVAISGSGEAAGEEVEFSSYGTAAVFGPCPNDSFRIGQAGATLPDCRAYEQVSPTGKNGANIQAATNFVQASSDGERFTFFTNTGIPGGEGSQQFPIYMADRAPGGSDWSSHGLLPPASYGTTAGVLGWTEELTDTYDYAAKEFGSGQILRRSSADESLTPIATGPASTFRQKLLFAAASEHGTVALLESAEGDILPGDDSGAQNLYAYDRASGRIAVAGVLNPASPGAEPEVPPGGAMAGPYGWQKIVGGTGGSNTQPTEATGQPGGALGGYYTQAEHTISDDGSRAFFTAGESGQIYVRENPTAPQSAMSGGQCTESAKACTITVSAPEAGITDPGTTPVFLGASADGNLAFFLDRGKLTSDATGGAGYDLYRFDLATKSLTDMTLDTTDKRGARVEGTLGISGSGQYLYFAAAGALTTKAQEAPSGETNLYALEGEGVHLIARLATSEPDSFDWAPRSYEYGAKTARLSADGQTLLFRSTRELTPYDNSGPRCLQSGGVLVGGRCPELYLYSAGSEDISCVSCNPTGAAPAGPSNLQEFPPLGFQLGLYFTSMPRNLSADGRRVIFDSADRLVAADRNDVNDVYEWEAPGQAEEENSCTPSSPAYVSASRGCLYLLSGGAADAAPSWFGDADARGRSIFFFTSQRLVPRDRDELVDVYDARIDGGIAGQQATTVVPCDGETGCLLPGVSASTPQPPQTLTANGSNVVPRKPCGKGKVRKHGHCVAKPKRKKHQKHHRGKKANKHAGKPKAKHRATGKNAKAGRG
jgi:hypothetical protein